MNERFIIKLENTLSQTPCKYSFVPQRFVLKCINHFANNPKLLYDCPTIYEYRFYFYLGFRSFQYNLLTLHSVEG